MTTKAPLGVLKRIRELPARPRPGERCELCAEVIPDDHGHVVDIESRSLRCTCRPCTLLFTHDGAGGGRFRAVPDRYVSVDGFQLSPGQWEALQIPVRVAFFFRNSKVGDIGAFYPSPAGATECLLPLDAWADIETANPVVATVEPDVEAVLLRSDGAAVECYIVPIDACYELVGHLRRLWRGFDGGREVHDQLETFFSGVQQRARTVSRHG